MADAVDAPLTRRDLFEVLEGYVNFAQVDLVTEGLEPARLDNALSRALIMVLGEDGILTKGDVLARPAAKVHSAKHSAHLDPSGSS